MAGKYPMEVLMGNGNPAKGDTIHPSGRNVGMDQYLLIPCLGG